MRRRAWPCVTGGWSSRSSGRFARFPSHFHVSFQRVVSPFSSASIPRSFRSTFVPASLRAVPTHVLRAGRSSRRAGLSRHVRLPRHVQGFRAPSFRSYVAREPRKRARSASQRASGAHVLRPRPRRTVASEPILHHVFETFPEDLDEKGEDLEITGGGGSDAFFFFFF